MGQKKVPIHRLIKPFQLENTKDWRERQRISQLLHDIEIAAQEVQVFVSREESDPCVAEADDSMRNLERLTKELFSK